MARRAKYVKDIKYYPKWRVRKHNRCPICGRPRGFIRFFGMCRLCFREHALRGDLPGVRKSSW